jgi:hypothetical protein
MDGIGNTKKITSFGVLNQLNQPAQFGHFSHLDPLINNTLATHREDQYDVTDFP